MIATNLLAQIALTLVTNFSATARIPTNAVPTRIEDLETFVYGGGRYADMFLRSRNGSFFGLRGGVVNEFRANENFYRRASSRTKARFQGTPVISSNQAVQLATTVVKRLAKRGNLVDSAKPVVERSQEDGESVPFYFIYWPSTNGFLIRVGAQVEVDARKGEITYLELEDDDFFDLPFMEEMLGKVSTPDPPQPPPKRVNPYPMQWTAAHTNQIERGIQSWSRLCKALGISTGENTSLGEVDWEMSSVCTNTFESRSVLACSVRFKDWTGFETIDGVAICHVGPDPYYLVPRTRESQKAHTGKINHNWQDLAKELQQKVVNNIGLSHFLVSPYRAAPETDRPEVGTVAIKRMLLEWRNWPVNPGRTVRVEETKQAWEAEVDLETGELIWFCFRDPEFITAVIGAANKSK